MCAHAPFFKRASTLTIGICVAMCLCGLAGALGVMSAVVSRTNVSAVLRLDTVATDAYNAAATAPTFVYYNPTLQDVWVRIACELLCKPLFHCWLHTAV